MSISSVSSAASPKGAGVAPVSQVPLETASAAVTAVIETAGQIQLQIDQLEVEVESQATPQVAQEIQQLQEAQQEQRRDQVREVETAGVNDVVSDNGPVTADVARRLETRA